MSDAPEKLYNLSELYSVEYRNMAETFLLDDMEEHDVHELTYRTITSAFFEATAEVSRRVQTKLTRVIGTSFIVAALAQFLPYQPVSGLACLAAAAAAVYYTVDKANKIGRLGKQFVSQRDYKLDPTARGDELVYNKAARALERFRANRPHIRKKLPEQQSTPQVN